LHSWRRPWLGKIVVRAYGTKVAEFAGGFDDKRTICRDTWLRHVRIIRARRHCAFVIQEMSARGIDHENLRGEGFLAIAQLRRRSEIDTRAILRGDNILNLGKRKNA